MPILFPRSHPLHSTWFPIGIFDFITMSIFYFFPLLCHGRPGGRRGGRRGRCHSSLGGLQVVRRSQNAVFEQILRLAFYGGNKLCQRVSNKMPIAVNWQGERCMLRMVRISDQQFYSPHNSAATSAVALNGGRGREGPEKRRERPPLPTAAAFAGARCDLARFHKDGIGRGFQEINIVCVSWKKMRSVITAREEGREGHRRRRGNGSTVTVLLHSLIRRSGENRGWRRVEGSAEARAAGARRRDSRGESQISFGVGRVNVADYLEKFQVDRAEIEWRQTIQFSGHWVGWTIQVSAGRTPVFKPLTMSKVPRANMV